jgi:hypothetical protein
MVFMAALVPRRGIMVLVIMVFMVPAPFPLSGLFCRFFSDIIILRSGLHKAQKNGHGNREERIERLGSGWSMAVDSGMGSEKFFL